ncbi:MAG: hypothetical protein IT379_08260 [Deltaproteobacteria bacterium]|nr:hypothetical protein [Deltaproteobacteria bacterium]
MRSLVPLSVLLLACGDDAGSPRDGGPQCAAFPVSLQVRGPDYAYHDIPGDADLVLGFQGFRYIYLRARTSAEPPVMQGSVVAEPEGQSLVSQPVRFSFSEEDDGVWLSDPVIVFFNDIPLPSLVGQGCRVWMRVGDERCGGEAEGRVVLRYDPRCYEGGMGERICTDADVPRPFEDDGGAP